MKNGKRNVWKHNWKLLSWNAFCCFCLWYWKPSQDHLTKLLDKTVSNYKMFMHYEIVSVMVALLWFFFFSLSMTSCWNFLLSNFRIKVFLYVMYTKMQAQSSFKIKNLHSYATASFCPWLHNAHAIRVKNCPVHRVQWKRKILNK